MIQTAGKVEPKGSTKLGERAKGCYNGKGKTEIGESPWLHEQAMQHMQAEEEHALGSLGEALDPGAIMA